MEGEWLPVIFRCEDGSGLRIPLCALKLPGVHVLRQLCEIYDPSYAKGTAQGKRQGERLHCLRATLVCLAKDHVLTGAQFSEVQARIGYLHGKFQKCGKDGCVVAAVSGASFCADHISLGLSTQIAGHCSWKRKPSTKDTTAHGPGCVCGG